MKGKGILAVAVAGGLFVAGLLSPDSWRSAVSHQVERLSAPAASSPKDVTPPAASAAPSDNAADDGPPPVPVAEVRRPLMLAQGQQLGLGLGMFTTPDAASALSERLAALGYKTQAVALQDENRATWYLLIAGAYDNESDAESARAILAGELSPQALPDIVLIPPPPKKK